MIGLGFLLAGCGQWRDSSRLKAPNQADALVFLTRDGCMASDLVRARLDDALRAMGRPAAYTVIDLATLPASDPRTAYPTPTILYMNHDVFGSPEPKPPFPEPT
jgi:hypothetical protein